MAFGSRADTKRALEAAAKAMPAWMKLTAFDRAKVLKKTADLMRERADAIARTLTMEQGKPLAEAKAEVLHSADTFEWFAEEGKRAYGQLIPNSQPGKKHVTLKHPIGVVGAISPWNFPITLQRAKSPLPWPPVAPSSVNPPANRPSAWSRFSSAWSMPACRRASPTSSWARLRRHCRRIPGKSTLPQDQLHWLDGSRQATDARRCRPGQAR